MSAALDSALSRARLVLDTTTRGPVAKTIFASPAGKKRLAKRLVAMLPEHATYVEPFAGSAAVLFEKEPSNVEAINDADPDIAEAYRLIKRLNPKKLERLRAMKWTGDQATYKRLYGSSPSGELERLYKFLYLATFSYGKLRGSSFNHNAAGKESRTIARLEQNAPRLQSVRVHSGDYLKVVKKYDGASTAFFFDPPYAGYDVDVGEGKFDEERFYEVLKGLRGRFLLTYGIRGKLPSLLKGSGFRIQRVRTPRGIRSMRGVGGSSVLTQLVVTNYALPTRKDDWLEPWDGQLELGDTVPTIVTPPVDEGGEAFAKSMPLIKGADPTDERYVLGVVLEPETVDAQGDVYSADEVRKAAHRFMEEYQGLGLQHELRVNDQVKILE
ncbi:MAG: DNA adenine methylase, partial [Myxococcales bacterium]|nr:DNA adenine methylase [Myxococcales bacterium]